MSVAGQALIEAYSVLTRLPSHHRLSPSDAAALLGANFLGEAVVSLDAAAYREIVSRLSAEGVRGGQAYDAVIAACARAAGAEALLTFNARHFVGLVERDLRVVVPRPVDTG